jgi:hypothetical protein
VARKPAVAIDPTAGIKPRELRKLPGCYLICFDQPLVLGINVRHEVRHYLGTSVNMATRLEKHATRPDARLLQLAKARGITWRVVRIWAMPESNQPERYRMERRLKQIKPLRLCPCCHPGNRRGCFDAKAPVPPEPTSYGEEYEDYGDDQPF